MSSGDIAGGLRGRFYITLAGTDSPSRNDLTGRPYPDRISNEQYERQLDEFEKHYWRPIDGAIPICHVGCAIRVWLVVSGQEAGHVWLDDRASDKGIAPITAKDGRRMTAEAVSMARLISGDDRSILGMGASCQKIGAGSSGRDRPHRWVPAGSRLHR